MYLQTLKSHIISFVNSDTGKIVLKISEYVINIGIIGLLLWQLFSIGIITILKQLPNQPGFYLLFLVLFITLPVAELFTYRQYWDFSNREWLPIFIKKRIYNNSFIGYSGEIYLSVELKKRFHFSSKELFDVIRDNNILSSLASSLFALTVLSTYLLTGKPLPFGIGDLRLDIIAYIFIALIILLLVLPGNIRAYVFNSDPKQAISVGLIHFIRLLFLVIIQIWQWDIVISYIPLSTWITLAAVQVITSRLPFLPNKDVLFIIAGVQLSTGLQIPTDALAGLLIVHTMLDKVLSLILFGVISYFQPTTTSGST